jgi:hypothetical protein
MAEKAAWALVIVPVVHGLTPAETEAEGYLGLVGGLALLVAAMVAVVGFRAGRLWATPLTGWTGLIIAVGFTLYHAVPFHSDQPLLRRTGRGSGVGVGRPRCRCGSVGRMGGACPPSPVVGPRRP